MSTGISSAQYFTALTAVGAGAIGLAIKDLAAHSPSVLDAPSCIEQPWVKLYPIAPKVNDVLCAFNTSFMSVAQSPGGRLLLEYFAAVAVAAVLVTVYEGFRPSSRRSAGKESHGSTEGFGMRLGVAQLSTFALAAAQIITAGIALPAYYALVSWSTPRHWRRHHHKIDLGDEVFFMTDKARAAVKSKYKHSVQHNANVPRSSYVYTTLVSTIVGFILPTAAIQYAPWLCKYDALSVWQIYPVYMLAINLVMPPLLRKGFTGVAPKVGIWMIAALGIGVSLYSHFNLVSAILDDQVGVTDVFTLNPDHDDRLSWSAHRFFVTDFVLTTLAAGSKVLLALARRTRVGAGGKTIYAIILLAVATVVGPGASIMGMWAHAELTALRHAKDYAEAKEAKGAVVEEIQAEVIEVK